MTAAGNSSSSGKTVLLFANTDWYLYNFRLALAEAIRDRGDDVVLVSPAGEYGHRFAEHGFRWIPIDLYGNSQGPVANLKALNSVREIYRQEVPDLVHHFTIKCVLLGGVVARRMEIPCVNAVTGLGQAFSDESPVGWHIRYLVERAYRYSCNRTDVRVVFQNDEDAEKLTTSGIVAEDRCRIIRGSGANTDRFRPSSQLRRPGPCRFLFASRLLWEKGLGELTEACRMLRRRDVDFELSIAGNIYPANPSSLSEKDVDDLRHHATVLGHVDDMPQLIAESDVVVLPSYYREGTPRILLEAGAAGKPLIAADIAACEGIVCPGQNGYLVKPRDANSLADAMQQLASSQSLREEYGRMSRGIVLEDFSEVSVVSRTLDIYDELLGG